MKKFLKDVCLFLAWLVPLYIVLVVLWGYLMPSYLRPNLPDFESGYGHLYTRLQEASRTRKTDVLVLGSSHAYRGFDPRIFKQKGYTLFNLGSSAQSPIQSGALLHHYGLSTHPGLVVFEVYPFIFENDGTESGIDVISNARVGKHIFKMAWQNPHLKHFNVLIFRSFEHFLGLESERVEDLERDDDFYVSGGFVERKVEKYESPVNPPKQVAITPLPKQWNAFLDVLQTLKDNSIPFVLVQAPVTARDYSTVKNRGELDSLFKSVGVYYDFNQISPLPDSLFYDAHHLNQLGVKVFNERLIKVLEDDGILKKNTGV